MTQVLSRTRLGALALALVAVGMTAPAQAVPIVVPQDIVVVTDSSGSLTNADWILSKNFLSSLNLGMPERNLSRVGVVQFATGAFTRYRIDQDQTPAAVSTAINNMPYTMGNTFTLAGLTSAVSQFQTYSAPINPKTILLITDGVPNPATTQNPCGSSAAAVTFRADLAAQGAEVVMVGVGAQFSAAQLSCLYDNPSTNLFELPDFDAINDLMTNETFLAHFGLGYVYDDAAVPAPAPLALLGLGLVGMAIVRRRRAA